MPKCALCGAKAEVRCLCRKHWRLVNEQGRSGGALYTAKGTLTVPKRPEYYRDVNQYRSLVTNRFIEAPVPSTEDTE